MIVVYIILLLVSLLFYIQYEGAFSFYLFFFTAAYPVIFGILTFITKRKLRVSFESAEQSAPKGSSVPVNIIIDNDSIIPVPSCDIMIKYKTDAGKQADSFRIHTPVFPKNTQVLTVRLSYRHYGTMRVELARVRIFDILRIVRFRVKTKGALERTSISVYPDHIPIASKINDYSELGLESDNYSKNKKGDDPSEIFDIHSYNEGDKISRIHWKLSAKQDSLMVKDYSMPITNGVLLAVNLKGLGTEPRELDKLDTLIDAVSAVSLHLAECEMPHTVMWCTNIGDGYENRTVSDFESYTLAVRELVNVNFREVPGDPAAVISELATGIARYAHIIFFTNGFSDIQRSMLTESGYAYRYTVLDTAANTETGYSEERLVYAPLRVGAVADCLENIII